MNIEKHFDEARESGSPIELRISANPSVVENPRPVSRRLFAPRITAGESPFSQPLETYSIRSIEGTEPQTRRQAQFNADYSTNRRYSQNLAEICSENVMRSAIDRMNRGPCDLLPTRFASSAPFPLKVFPLDVQEHLLQISRAFGVPVSLVGSLFLGAIAVACRGKLRVARHSSHHELMTLFFLLMLPPSKGKSPVQKVFINPLHAAEKEAKRVFSEESPKQKMKRSLQKRALKKAESLFANIDASDADLDCAAELLAEKEKLITSELVEPNWLASTHLTMAGIERDICKQGGVLGIVGSELGAFKAIPENRDDILSLGYEGSPFSYSKATGKPLRADSVRLAILLFVQNFTSLKLLDKRGLQEDGLLARFLVVSAPDEDLAGIEAGDEVPESTQVWINALIQRILSIPEPTKTQFNDLSFASTTSLDEWKKFFIYTNDRCNDPSLSSVLRGFYGKLAGTALRFAGFLHLIEHENAVDVPISEVSIDNGIALSLFYESQALASLDPSNTKRLDNAKKILRHAQRHNIVECNMRDICRSCNLAADECIDALQLLQEYNIATWRKIIKSTIVAFHRNIRSLPNG